MAAPRKYPDEVRDRAVRLVRDLIDGDEEGITVTGACRRVGEQPGISTDTLRNWVMPALIDLVARSASISEHLRVWQRQGAVLCLVPRSPHGDVFDEFSMASQGQ